MAVISDAQIAAYAQSAGLSGSNVAIAVAVALAESGGDTASHNDNPATGDDSYGLWQINMIGDLGPSRRAQFQITSNDQLLDPATNARAMASISHNGANWAPWTTYTSGRYLAYLTRGRTAANNPAVDVTPVSAGTGGFKAIAGAFGNITSLSFWIRVAEFIIGAYLVYIALIKMTGATGKIAKYAKVAGKVAVLAA